MNWILSGSWSRHKVNSQNFYQNQPGLCRSIHIDPALTSREYNVFADKFVFWNLFMSFERFCQPACFLQLDLQWDSPKFPWRMHRICRPSVLKTIIMPFERLFVPWHSLIRSLHFIQVYIFIPLIHSAHSCAFDAFYFTPIFSYVHYHEKYFSYPWWHCAQNLIIIFNFSSQRPHLNYIFLSNIHSFDTMEFSMKHKC